MRFVRALLLVGGALAVTACASSKSGTDCDPNVDVCTCGEGIDCPTGFVCGPGGVCEAESLVDAGPDPDAPPRNGFGEPCTDKTDCESNICILVGTTGICTELCSGDDCPDGFGCFGVLDSVEPGQVDDVCVPLANTLCSPCTDHSECAAIGQDLCVADGLGDEFCARDCSVVECPTGYTCQTVEVDGDDYRQCIPNSGFCDCVAANQGLTEPCTIQTPAPYNRACAGTRTCLGDGGWGACEPPSTTDDPDGAFADSNCDGIDGDVTRGIFVAVSGNNDASCGLGPTTPCQTIAYGVVRAAQSSRVHVYVQTGTYNEVVPVVNGISIFGGYDVTWERFSYSDPAHQVRIVGRKDDAGGGTNQFLTIRAHGASVVPVTIDNLIIEAPDATEAGKSSYAVHVSGSQVNLTNVQVIGGDGASGAPGTPGLDAVSLAAAPTGGTGGGGTEANRACSTGSGGGGGTGANNTCSSSPSSRDMRGGDGGAGGSMDTSCGWTGICSNCDARAGGGGAQANHSPGVAGDGGGGGPPNASGCNDGNGTPGGTGITGQIENGPPGSGGSGGAIASGFWAGARGGDGGTGHNGGGGCDDGTDAEGAGGGGAGGCAARAGGGGGAGGCAARAGGGGGGGGGGSFGVFAVNGSTVTIASCSIQRGNGGASGAGGRGQPDGTAPAARAATTPGRARRGRAGAAATAATAAAAAARGATRSGWRGRPAAASPTAAPSPAGRPGRAAPAGRRPRRSRGRSRTTASTAGRAPGASGPRPAPARATRAASTRAGGPAAVSGGCVPGSPPRPHVEGRAPGRVPPAAPRRRPSSRGPHRPRALEPRAHPARGHRGRAKKTRFSCKKVAGLAWFSGLLG